MFKYHDRVIAEYSDILGKWKVCRIKRNGEDTFYLTQTGWKLKLPSEPAQFDKSMLWDTDELEDLAASLLRFKDN